MKVFIIIILWIVITLMTGCNKKEIDISVENTQSQESRVDEKEFDTIQNTPEEESQIATIYRQILSQYLLETLELETYDQELSNSEMRYIPNEGNDVMYVQERDKMNLTYLYLRNELHVERLTDEHVAILLEESVNGNVYSDKAKEVVLKTFANVIAYKEIKSDADKKIKTSYDSSATEDFVTVDALVLVIGNMKEFDENGNFVDYSHEIEKLKELEKFAANMEEDLNGKLGEVPIRVLFER